MKHLFFILLLSMASLCAIAQRDTNTTPDSARTTQQDTALAESGEAGGITANEADDTGSSKSLADYWVYLLVGGLVIAGLSAAVTRALTPKKKAAAAPEPEVIHTSSEPSRKNSITAAEARQLKQEADNLRTQLAKLQGENDALDKSLGIYRNFDSNYYGEAFRKLVAPMNEALESGSRKEILENLMKIMIHFTSLTRYKIAKKQPYDEANIHYLLNQKGNGDASVTEINGDTPVDKIPKNIKTVIDMLKEQESKGLDDSILAGYKIKAL